MVKDIKCLFMLPKIFKTYLRKLSTFREIWEWCEKQGAGKVITFLVSLWRNVYENWYIIHALVFSTSLLLCPKTNTFSSWWSYEHPTCFDFLAKNLKFSLSPLKTCSAKSPSMCTFRLTSTERFMWTINI